MLLFINNHIFCKNSYCQNKTTLKWLAYSYCLICKSNNFFSFIPHKGIFFLINFSCRGLNSLFKLRLKSYYHLKYFEAWTLKRLFFQAFILLFWLIICRLITERSHITGSNCLDQTNNWKELNLHWTNYDLVIDLLTLWKKRYIQVDWFWSH